MIDKISDWIYWWSFEIFVVCTIISTVSVVATCIVYIISKI